MTLYNQKDSNIRKTWLLFVVFLIVIIGIGWAFSYIYNSPGILYIAIIFSLVMNLISYWYSDKIVLKMNKAILVERKDNPDLYNIVENLSITAGLPIPKIFIVNEEQLNAFATGRDPQHAVVAVTVGLLRKLNKTELDGVLAHELSHIGNRDILISTVAVVLVGFISILGDMFFRSMFWGGFGRRNDREGGQAGAIIMIIGVVLAILAPITATLIQLAISRKRELLADASGALLTRYPDGLISALEKISLDTNPMKVANNTTAHLWLDNPFKGQKTVSWMTKLFLTHPPIEERIKALKNLKI